MTRSSAVFCRHQRPRLLYQGDYPTQPPLILSFLSPPKPKKFRPLTRSFYCRYSPSAKAYADDLFSIIKDKLPQLNIGDFKGKTVVLKPNMVECPDKAPITTRPEVLRAAIKLVDYLGAKNIIVAEGPGHMRDTELILATTGIGEVCQEMAVPFVDLNLDDCVKVPIKHSFTGYDHFILPKTIMKADAVVSLPKMKTHHWVGMTAAMKNLLALCPDANMVFQKIFALWWHCALYPGFK